MIGRRIVTSYECDRITKGRSAALEGLNNIKETSIMTARIRVRYLIRWIEKDYTIRLLKNIPSNVTYDE